MKIRLIVAMLLACLCSQLYAAEFSLFGDAKVVFDNDAKTTYFELGELDFTLYEDLSETSSVTADIIYAKSEHGYEIDVERLLITKKVHDLFSVTLGKFHKPVGFWLHNFHHASLSQDTITSPFFLENDETHEGVFPTHLIGLLFEGIGKAWSYQFGVVNSNGINTENSQVPDFTTSIETINGKDPSKEKTVIGRLTFGPRSWPVEFGLFAMQNDVVETGETNTLVEPGKAVFEQLVYGLDINLRTRYFYLFGEYIDMAFKDNADINQPPFVASVEDYNAQAFYAQLGVYLGDHLTAAVRYESLDFEENSTYFDIQGILPETRKILAFKYKFDDSNALRFEVNDAHRNEQEDVTYYSLQWFFYLL